MGGMSASSEESGSVVLVTGGTGTLGRAVVARLREGKHAVRVLSRRTRPAEEPADRGAANGSVLEWATGDLNTGAGLTAAVTGVGSIIHCATSGTGKDVEGTRRLIEAVREAGEQPHLVYISIVGVDRVPFFYYRAKLEVEKIIQDSGLPWSVLRTTQFHDLIARITTIQRRLPVTMCPAGLSFQPIDVRDVAERLVELSLDAPAGRVSDMGGPEVRTARELVQLTLGAYGLRRPVLPMPLPGKAGRGYRAGHHMTPEHAVGRITYTEYLEGTVGSPAKR
jgi:uncharacterized protein YbjT (DUF2867 family)